MNDKMLLSEEEIRRAYSARCDRSIMGGYKNIAKAQLAKCELSEPLIRADERTKFINEMEKYCFYVDTRGYFSLKPNATHNWGALKKGEMPDG